MMKTINKILYGSNEAAHPVTGLSGWVDSYGVFYGDNENAARYSGCTHVPCKDCGEPTLKGFLCCDKCREKLAIEKHKKRPKTIWNGDTPLYSDAIDEYFYDEDDLRDYIHEQMCTVESLRLLICEPVYLKKFDGNYFYEQLLDDTDELPSELEKAIDELNQVVVNLPLIGYEPTEFAAIVWK